MASAIELPPALQHLAALLDQQPPEVRDLFRYALTLAIIDDEKARVIGSRDKRGRRRLTLKTIAGDMFEIIRHAISEELEAELRMQVETIFEDEAEIREIAHC
jgi:hypothetical protein